MTLLGEISNRAKHLFRLPGRPKAVEIEQTVATGRFLAAWPRSRNGKGALEADYADQLLVRKGFALYKEMMRDEQVKAALTFKKVLISGRSWSVEPADVEDEESKKQALFVQRMLERMNWNRVMREALTALEFGFSVAEKIFEVVDGKTISEDTEDGPKLVIVDVKHRDPEWMKIDIDKHGNVVQFRQQPYGVPLEAEEILLGPEKVMHFTYQGQFSNPYGISDLSAAYRAWWSKKFIQQFWNVFLERFGSPLMKMVYPEGASTELQQNLRKILDGLSSRTDILVPNGVQTELIEATRAGTAQYGEAMNYCDVAISRAVLVPALLGMGVDIKRGSDSQSRLHLRVLMKVANDVSIDLEECINDQIIKQVIDFNFEDVKRYPKFKFQDYGEYEAIEIVDSMINMFNAGMLDADQDDINYARSVLGLRLREEDEEDEVLRAPPPPVGTSPNNPNASGAGAGKNNSRAQKGPATKKTKPK